MTDRIFEQWDEGGDGIAWIHSCIGEDGEIRVGITPDEQHFIIQFKEKTVSLSFKRFLELVSINLGSRIKEKAKVSNPRLSP